MTNIVVQRSIAKRQVAAARALLTFVGTLSQNESITVDPDTGDRLCMQLDAATEAMARAIYTIDPKDES